MSGALYMPLWTDAYLGDTPHLTTVQHGAYLLLLISMWRNDGSLPNDEKRLARIARLPLNKWRQVRQEVLELCRVEGDAITQKRLSLELQKSIDLVRKRSSAGRAGFQAKQLKSKSSNQANAEHVVEPVREQSASLPSPISHLQSPISNIQSLKEKEEEEGYAAVPAREASAGVGVHPTQFVPRPEYAFEEGIIKLTQAELDKLVKAFPHVNVPGELLACSHWIAAEAKKNGKDWLMVAKGRLAKQDRTRSAEAADRVAAAQAAAAAASKPKQSRI